MDICKKAASILNVVPARFLSRYNWKYQGALTVTASAAVGCGARGLWVSVLIMDRDVALTRQLLDVWMHVLLLLSRASLHGLMVVARGVFW